MRNIGYFVIALSLFQISCGNNDSKSTSITIPESESNQNQSDKSGASEKQNQTSLNIEEHIRYRKKWYGYNEQNEKDTFFGDVIIEDIKIQDDKFYYKRTRIVGGTEKAWFSEMESKLKKNGAVGSAGGCDHTIYNYIVIIEGIITINKRSKWGDIIHPTYHLKFNSGSIKSITKINELWMGNDGTKISGDDKIIFDESRDCSGDYFTLSKSENKWDLYGLNIGE